VYRERAEHPMTTVDPDEASGPRPLSAVSQSVQHTIATFADAISAGET